MDNKTIAILGVGGLVAAYFLLESNQTVPALAVQQLLPAAVPQTTALIPVTTATPATTAAPVPVSTVTPTVPGAPAAPMFYNDTYYKEYQYPALVALYPNLRNVQYQLTDQDALNYYNNYLELQQWYAGEAKKQFPSQKAAMQYHWTTFGVPYEYSFIPFTPPKNANWIPPPPQPKKSSGILQDIVKGATVLTGGILEVTSAGTLTPLVAAGTSAALTAESAIHGPNDVVLNDLEVEVIVTSAAIIKKILPFYLQVDKTLVNSINNQVDQLVNTYALS